MRNAIIDLLQNATQQLASSSPSPRLDAELLLAHALKKNRSFLYAYPERLIDDVTVHQFHELLSLRCHGHPIAHLIGIKEFWSLPLEITNNTLIPRPETEHLVEVTLSLLASSSTKTVLDLGTGSGAVALALANERPHWQIIACDINQPCVDVARRNAQRLGLTNLRFYCSDWFNHLPIQRFDAIVSNPPYIAEHDPHLSLGDVRFEPKRALVSGPEGLDAIHHIIQHSRSFLNAKGLLLLEHGYAQKSAVHDLLQRFGFDKIQSWQDWQGLDRISKGQLNV